MATTRILDQSVCRQLLTYENCIPAMTDVLKAFADGKVKMLQRSAIPHENGNLFALMTASVAPLQCMGSKVVVFPGPEAAKNKTSQGIIPLFDTETGALLAIVDASVITVVRTASVSAAATDALAVKDADSLAILGTGRQGIAHVKAIAAVRDIRRLFLWNRTAERAENAALTLKEEFPDMEIQVCAAPEEAVRSASIVCTTTSPRQTPPVLQGEWLKPGTHVNAVGAVSPFGQEIDTAAILKSRVFFDWKEAALSAGDFAVPMKNGELPEDCGEGEIGAVFAGSIEGRTLDADITLFKSVGIAAEDIAAAWVIYQKAKEAGLGTEVSF